MTHTDQFSKELTHDLIQLRETLHQYPELSNHEVNTQQVLLAALEKCDAIDIKTPGTSIVARIKGMDPYRPPVAIRGDIDALPITEDTGVPFSSKTPGVMHACGHDVHATWAIGAARLLSQSPARSDVILILQQAEELATGAKFLMDSGALPSDIRAIFGAHVDRRYDVGKVVCHQGVISSHSDKFTIEIMGVGAHAARPKEGINPIPILGEITLKLKHLMESIGDDTNLITVTTVSGGGAHNIIPERAELSGTIRCLSSEKRAQFHQALRALGALPSDAAIHVRIEPGSPSVVNHEGLESIAQSSIRDTLGNSGMVPLVAPNMASEDFGFYTQAFPGWFYRIGSRPIGEGFIPVHTPAFIADEHAIFIGASVLAKSAQFASQQTKSYSIAQ